MSCLVNIASASAGVLPLTLLKIPLKPSNEPLKPAPKAPPKPRLNKYSSRLTSSPNKSLRKVSPTPKPAPKAPLFAIPLTPLVVAPPGIIWIRPAAIASAWLICFTPLAFCAAIFA